MMVTRSFFLQITVLFSLSSALFADGRINQDELLVQSLYPGAQFWFNTMIAKYPQARLNCVKFCVSDSYEATADAIYFPVYRLKEMNKVFVDFGVQKINLDQFEQFKEDEYLLLHEAHHVLNKDGASFDNAVNCALVAFLGLHAALLVKCCQQEDVYWKDVGISVAGGTGIYVALCLYARYQESNADNFANQIADKNALLAGAVWFEHLDYALNIYHGGFPDCLIDICKTFDDPDHPLPKNRANRARKAYKERFELLAV
jgi:hypothetical protein